MLCGEAFSKRGPHFAGNICRVSVHSLKQNFKETKWELAFSFFIWTDIAGLLLIFDSYEWLNA